MPLYLYKEFNGFPIGTEITDYVSSIDMFKPAPDNKIYIATIKGKEYVLPPEYTTMFKPASEKKKKFDKDKALELIKFAEQALYDKFMLPEDNELKTFLENNNVIVTHSPRKCISCGRLATDGCYCHDHYLSMIWSEPGY
jgi:hypothetical protein